MYDIVCDKFYIQSYWGTIGSMKWNVLQLQLRLFHIQDSRFKSHGEELLSWLKI
jgi:hypothetical protein